MSRQNIDERREYICQLIDGGASITPDVIKGIIKRFDSSYPAVLNDISMVTIRAQQYHKPQVANQNTRARKMGSVGTLTEDEWKQVLKEHNYSCARCGKRSELSIDHVVPLSRGGTNTADNIQPLCKSCNSRKSNRV